MRKTISMILLVSLWTQMVFAAGVPQKFPTDTLQIGKPSSSANKDLIFDTNLGASNPKVRANPTSGKFELNKPLDVTGAIGSTGAVTAGGAITTTSGDISTANGNISATGTGSIGGNLTIGTGAAADKSITVNRGGSNPFLKWSETALSWIFSNDGTLEKKLGTGGGGASTGVNVLTNDSFEDFVSGALLGWSNVGGTLTQQTYTNGVENDTKYFQFVATGAGQYFESALITVPTNFNGGGCQVDFKKLNIATNDLFKVEALDSSSNVLATGNVKVSSWSKFPTLSFSCPAAGATFRIRVTSLAAGTLQGDKAYLGSNQNIVYSSQAKLLGSLNTPANLNCQWSWTGLPFSDSAADADCLTATGSGGVTNPDTKIPALKIPRMAKGNYLIILSGGLIYNTSNIAAWRLFDGTNASTSVNSYQATVQAGHSNYSFSFSNASDRENVTLRLQSSINGGSSTVDLSSIASNYQGLRFDVYFYPDSSDVAVSPEQASWFIDANIGGGNPGTSVNSSYTEYTLGTLDLVNNTSKGSADVQIACASGTDSTGNTCTVNESVGVTFTNPSSGLYRACFYYNQVIQNGNITSQIIETTPTSSAIVQEGGTKSHSYSGNSTTLVRYPSSNCSIFNFSDSKRRTLRLMYEADTTTGSIIADRDSLVGQRDIHITIENISFGQNRPILLDTPIVAASYWLSANFAATLTTPVNYDQKEYDTHNAVTVSPTAWKFTAPIDGLYRVGGMGYWNTINNETNLYKNGTLYKICGYTANAAGSRGWQDCTIKLNQGDYIDIRPGIASNTMQGGAFSGNSTSNISITRLGK